MGNNYSAGAATHLGNWSEYRASLEPAHRKIFETGFQFPRLAVQEPQGIMILRVGERYMKNIDVSNPSSK